MDQTITDVYTSVLHTQLKQYTPWPFAMSIRLGDYGTLKGAIFDRIGNIGDKNDDYHVAIPIQPVQSAMPVKFEYQSIGTRETRGQLTANIGSGITGGVPVKLKANLRVEFSSGNSVYFKAFNCIYNGIENISAIGKEIVNLFGRKVWSGNFVVVTHLFQANSATIIASMQSGGMIDIQAKSDAIEYIDLADVNAGLYTASKENIGMDIVAETGYIPLFGLSQVRRRLPDWIFRRPGRFENIFALSEKETNFQGVSADLLMNAQVDVSLEGVDLTNKSIEDVFVFAERS